MDTITSPTSVSSAPSSFNGNGYGRAQKRHTQDVAAESVQAAQFAMCITQLLPDPESKTRTEALPSMQSSAGIVQIYPAAGGLTDTVSSPDGQSSAVVGTGQAGQTGGVQQGTMPAAATGSSALPDGSNQFPAESAICANTAGSAGLRRATPLPAPVLFTNDSAQTPDGAGHATTIQPSDMATHNDIADFTAATVLPDQDSARTMTETTQQHTSQALPLSQETPCATTAATAMETTAAAAASTPEAATTGVAGLADEFATKVTQFEQAGGSWTGNARITFRSNVWHGASAHITGSPGMLAIVVTPPSLAQAAAASLSSGSLASGIVLRQEKQLAAELSRKLGRTVSLHIAEAQETEHGPQAMGNAAADTETR